jgi:Family of unknown function (DUF6159)
MSGWKLAAECFAVLRSRRQLLLLPVVGSVASLVVTLLFALPLVFADRLDNDLIVVVTLFAYYFTQQVVTLFTSSALLHMVVRTFQGESPTLAEGISFSVSRLDKIFAWAGLGGVVGVILNRLDRGKEDSKVRKFLHNAVGGAWSLVSYFAFPILVLEGLGPVDAMKRSIDLIMGTWGTRVRAAQGFQLVSLAAFALGFVILLAGFGLTHHFGNTVWLIGAGVLLVPYTVLSVFLIVSLTQVFRAALYLYASGSEVKVPLPSQALEGAFVG